MSDDVKPARPYRSVQRSRQAVNTRRAVLAAAEDLFTAKGFTATTVAEIATKAGVNVDTLYAAVGRKPDLLRELVETAISGQDRAVPAEERDYVRAIRAAGTAREKIALYAAAVAAIAGRLAPVHLALRDAAARDQDCAALQREISDRRATNMLLFAADLRATGELRDDLTDQDVADIVWSMNAAEFVALLLHDRGWTSQRLADFLADAWTRLLLRRT